MNRGKLDDTLAAMFSNIKYRTNYLFYAHMLGQCSVKIREDLKAPAGVSFAIDHYNLYIDPKRFDEFSLEGRLSILKHEMLHILMGHLRVRGGELIHLPWNIATDCAINQHIDPQHLPDCAVMPENLSEKLKIRVPLNRTSEEYYNLIIQNQDGSSGEESGESGEGESMDSHEVWEESQGAEEFQDDLTKRMIEKAQEETIKSKGNLPSGCSSWIELVSRKSEINWQKVLRGIVGNKRVNKRSTIMRSDRRFPQRMELRGKTKDRMFNLLVVADVSGSMSTSAINSTLSEVKHICDITKTEVDMIQIDTVAYEPQKLTKKLKTIERKGNGGTNLYPAIEMANDRRIDYQAVVVITDGGLYNNDISQFGALKKKVIWLIEENGTVLDGMNSGLMKACKLKSS